MENFNCFNINLLIKRITANDSLLFILFISMCFQTIEILEFCNAHLKLYHLIFVVILFYVLAKNHLKVHISKILYAIFFFFFCLNLVVCGSFGIDHILLNYLFCFLLVTVVYTLSYNLSEVFLLKIIKIATMFIYAIVIAKNFFYFENIISFIRAPFESVNDRILIPCFFGGGINLEASFLAMFTIFFYKDKRAFFIFFISICISICYSSRTSMIINFLSFFFLFGSFLKKNLFLSFLLLIVIFFIFLLFNLDIVNYVISRFSRIGDEPGSIGRITMWKFFFDIIEVYPLGVGIGNSIKALESVSNLIFGEDNLHNLYLQMFIDLGIIGGSIYCLIIFVFLLFQRNKIFHSPILYFLFVYFISCLLQFRGAEPFIFYVLGLYFSSKKIIIN